MTNKQKDKINKSDENIGTCNECGLMNTESCIDTGLCDNCLKKLIKNTK